MKTGILSLLLLSAFALHGQEKGVLYGVVTDGGLNEPLPFATILIEDLNLGNTSDLDGRYRITSVPPGTHQVIFSYLGYESQTLTATIVAGEEVALNVTLSEGGVTMQEVVVSGQATGQRAAINQQINANSIVNIVSKEKLQELPDQNAAEAVGRLAGVSVYRDAGEGQRISIRGISPRFNAITVNGERLPSTEESERSVDLSMISPDMLAGIELFKAITPDMDGDAIGGTVNFTVKKADEGFRFLGRAMTGYQSLKNDYGQWRGNLSVGNRFLDNKLGLIVTGNFQKANRSNESVTSNYTYEGVNQNDDPVFSVENHNLADKIETRLRYGGSLTLDYSFNKDHNVLFNSSLGRTDRDELRYRRRFRIGSNYQEVEARQREQNITLVSNNLSGEHHLGKIDVDWRTSYSTSRWRSPHELRGRFREISAIASGIDDPSDIAALPTYFKNDLENMILYTSQFNTTKVNEDRFTSQLDLRYNFALKQAVTGYLKVGGKYRRVMRERDRKGQIISPYLSSRNPATNDPSQFLTNGSGQILLVNFLGDYSNSDFYGGAYDVMPGTEDLRDQFTTPLESVDIDRYNDLFGTSLSIGDHLSYDGHIDIEKIRRFRQRYLSDYIDDAFQNSGDYEGDESVVASYVMSSLNLGAKLNVTGGVRYEETDQSYTSFIIAGTSDDDPTIGTVAGSTTDGRRYHEWLPMFHLKYEATPWLDIRAAATKTLARPNFFNVVPWEYINAASREAQYGDAKLLHTTAWNYDLFVSLYNKMGLFTIGGFYKELKNIDFITTITETDNESVYKGWSITEPRNLGNTSTVSGLELDVQLNLRSMSNFLSGVVLGANLTLARSKTFYPLFNVETVYVGPPTFFETTVIDTVREGSIVGQADVLANINLGYEKGGFSGRISMVHQSDALSPGNPGIGSSESGVGSIPEQDYFDKASYRFDVAVKQRLGKSSNWTLFFNINNLTNTPEQAFLGIADRLREEEFYGMTMDLGVMYKVR